MPDKETKKKSNNPFFRKLAVGVSSAVGKPAAFLIAVLVILTWGLSGPLFNFSNTWQLFINTGTTIVTLLMVFLIQNTQNRDSKAIHIKLDELLKGTRGSRNQMINVEEMSDEDIEMLHQEFQKLHDKYEKELLRRNKK